MSALAYVYEDAAVVPERLTSRSSYELVSKIYANIERSMRGASPAPGLDLKRARESQSALSLLMALAEDDNVEALDGSITPAVIHRFLSSLPRTVGTSGLEPYVSSHGSVCFDWDDVPNNAMSFMVKNSREIGYSFFFDGECVYGSYIASQSSLPGHVSGLVHRWWMRTHRAQR